MQHEPNPIDTGLTPNHTTLDVGTQPPSVNDVLGSVRTQVVKRRDQLKTMTARLYVEVCSLISKECVTLEHLKTWLGGILQFGNGPVDLHTSDLVPLVYMMLDFLHVQINQEDIVHSQKASLAVASAYLIRNYRFWKLPKYERVRFEKPNQVTVARGSPCSQSVVQRTSNSIKKWLGHGQGAYFLLYCQYLL